MKMGTRVGRLVCSAAIVALLAVLAGCQGLVKAPPSTPPPPPTLQNSINHIVVMMQENRSLDSYFGALREYWAQNGFPLQAWDGLPQFNSPAGPVPSVPGCDPRFPFNPPLQPNDCIPDPTHPVQSFHFNTKCVENPSPSWNESHTDWNLTNPVSPTATNDGFVRTAGHDARQIVPPFNDTNGIRAMGYYDGTDLNYYYFMASSFATSDRWFAPVMTRTDPNRMYLLAATSQGHVYPLGKGSNPVATPLPATTIFQQLQQAGVTWKIYVHPDASGCTSPQCLFQLSYIRNFAYGQTVLNQFPQNLVTTSQFITDAQNGTLPQVALIEPASAVGLDEHPSDTDPLPGQLPCCSVQVGAKYVSTLLNSLMNGPNWKDSAFIFTFDEAGGFYDHVAPQPAVSPDGIKPLDLMAGDICTQTTGPNCDFVFTGFRVPMFVASPFAKKNFVSHAVADYTAILKLIETRFNLPALTKRDAAQIDMSKEFFDFANPAWTTPPKPPAQNTGGACYLDHLP
jgi:phospholipase C